MKRRDISWWKEEIVADEKKEIVTDEKKRWELIKGLGIKIRVADETKAEYSMFRIKKGKIFSVQQLTRWNHWKQLDVQLKSREICIHFSVNHVSFCNTKYTLRGRRSKIFSLFSFFLKLIKPLKTISAHLRVTFALHFFIINANSNIEKGCCLTAIQL